MSKLSVPEAAYLMGVSPMRVRQRIADGSLVAEKVGGRWLVDLAVSDSHQRRGRPVKPDVVWSAISLADSEFWRKNNAHAHLADAKHFHPGPKRGPDLILPDGSCVELKLSHSSQRRVQRRLKDVVDALQSRSNVEDSVSELLVWLSGRAERHLYKVAAPDMQPLREDWRLILSGLSHPRSGMQDPRIVEGYAARDDLEDLAGDHWLEPLGVDDKPNVVLHVAPGRPSGISPIMLAVDLAEHGGPRERHRAYELLAEALAP